MLDKISNSKFFNLANILSVCLIFALGIKQFALPSLAKFLYADEYKQMVFKCDNVMREHFIAKNKVLTKIDDDSVKNLKAAEVGLLECHDYDKLRKKLINLGLTDSQLGELGLETIEENAGDVRTFVKIHQIKY
jgi:hypothetical protein